MPPHTFGPDAPTAEDGEDAWTLARLCGLGWRHALRVVAAFVVAVAGAALFTVLDLPLPIFLGSLTACMVASLVRAPISPPAFLGVPMRAVLGVAVGAAFTPALLGAFWGMSLSLALIVPYTLVLTLLGTLFFERLAGFDRRTAFFSAVPGGLTDMVTMGAEAGGSARSITLVHATRIAFMVFTIPPLLEFVQGVSLGGRLPAVDHVANMRLIDAVVLLALAIGGYHIGKRLGIAGPALVGPMLASGLLHAAGVTAAKVPFEVLVLAQVALGMLLGCQFRGLTLRETSTTLLAAILFAALLLIVSTASAVAISSVTGFALLPTFLAFAPGGQAEIALLALILGIDVAFVALHHLVRLAIVIIGAQIVFAANTQWRTAAPS